MKDQNLNDEVAKILQEAPDARKALRQNYDNLLNVADYCCNNYIQSGNSSLKALEETKNFTTQSLASVAYQISTLASSVLSLLDAQTNQLQRMESSINLIGQTMDMHKEKVSRREIGVFTTVRHVPRSHKVIPPTGTQSRPSYSRRPINYQQLDELGHGMKVAGKQTDKTGTIRKHGGSIRSWFWSRFWFCSRRLSHWVSVWFRSSKAPEPVHCPVVPAVSSSSFGKPVATPTIPTTWQAPPECDIITTLLDEVLPPPLMAYDVTISSTPPPPPDSLGEMLAPPTPDMLGEILAPPPPPDSLGEMLAPPPPSDLFETMLSPTPPTDSVGEMLAPPPPPPPPPFLPAAPASAASPSAQPLAPPPAPPPLGLETVVEENGFPPPSPLPPPPSEDNNFLPLPGNHGSELPAPPPPPPPGQEADAALSRRSRRRRSPPTTRSVSLRVRSGPASRCRYTRSLFLPAAQSLMIPPPPPYPPPRTPLSPPSNFLLPRFSSSSPRLCLPARLEHLDLEIPAPPPPLLLDDEEGFADIIPPLPPPVDYDTDTPSQYLEKVVALYTYEASKPDDLSITEGDIIYLTHRHDNGWCQGVLQGKQGFFPHNYVQTCD